MNININKHLFAAYCGMMKSGYYLMDLSDDIVSEIYTWVSYTDFDSEISDYFSFTKTNTVSVNPYYPLGSDLSAACFFLNKSIDLYIDFLQMCGSPSAKDPLFINWASNIPNILRKIETHPEFNTVYQSYQKRLSMRFADVSEQISIIEHTLKTHPFNTEISLIFVPNILQSKFLTDYVFVDNTLYVIANTFSRNAIMHECLHITLKPVHHLLVATVRNNDLDRYVDVKCMLDLGYLHGDTPEDKAHVLEECIIRALCAILDPPTNLGDYCCNNIKSGFKSVPKIVSKLSDSIFSGMTLCEIVSQATHIV